MSAALRLTNAHIGVKRAHMLDTIHICVDTQEKFSYVATNIELIDVCSTCERIDHVTKPTRTAFMCNVWRNPTYEHATQHITASTNATKQSHVCVHTPITRRCTTAVKLSYKIATKHVSKSNICVALHCTYMCVSCVCMCVC